MMKNLQRCYMCKLDGKGNYKLGFVQTQCCACEKGVCKVHHNILCPPCAKSFVDGAELIQNKNYPLKASSCTQSKHLL